MAFSRGCWLSHESWNAHWPFSIGLLISTVLCCVLQVQSKRIDSHSLRDRPRNANRNMLKPLKDRDSYAVFLTLWRLPLEKKGRKKKTQKTKTPELVTSEEPHGFQILKPIPSYRVFVYVLFMENEHLNLSHLQCFCDLIARLGAMS